MEPTKQQPDPPMNLRDAWRRIRETIRRLGPAGPLAVFTSTFPPIGGFVLLGLVTRIAPLLRQSLGWGLTIYIGGFAASAALSLLPTYACSVLGGWTFGFAIGFPAAILAFMAATLIAWWVNSAVAGDRVIDILKEHPRWEAVRKALVGSGFWKSFFILTLIRVPPTSPFAAVNFMAATTRAPLGAFLLATGIGMAPRTGVVVWASAHAATLDFSSGTDRWMYFAGLGVTLAVVWIIGVIANRAVTRVTQANGAV